MEKFITVAVFDYVHEIQILKHRLDQEKLQYFFENEIMSSFAQCIPMLSAESNLKFIPTILKQ
jgi:hypothetical protein